MAGITTPTIDGKLSLMASITGMIMMEDVKVPIDNMLPLSNGLKSPFSCLNNARLGISWGTIGAAEYCFQTARQYVLDRS